MLGTFLGTAKMFKSEVIWVISKQKRGKSRDVHQHLDSILSEFNKIFNDGKRKDGHGSYMPRDPAKAPPVIIKVFFYKHLEVLG